MEFVFNFIEFFTQRSEFLMPILLSITVLGLSLGAAGLFKDNLFRTLTILPAALVLYAMGFAANDFGKEMFFNLSAELLTALAALIILMIYNIFESWASVLAIVALFALALLIFIDPVNNPQANLFVNLSTGLVGSFIIVGLLRREWSFSPENRDKMLWANVRERHKKQSLNLNEIGDYYILVLGGDTDEVKGKISFLNESNIQVQQDTAIEHDDETELHYQLVNAKIINTVKQEETVFLNNQEARMRLMAYPDTMKRVYKQIQEVLEVSDLKKLEAADPQMAHIEFKALSPKVIFSDYIEKQIMLLARRWRHGEKEHLTMATDDLLAWAKEMQFIDIEE